ncbi:MAG: TonB family protein [Pseudomonadota bacterium]
MHINKIILVLSASLLAACGFAPTDANLATPDSQISERYIEACEPIAEVPPKLIAGKTPKYPASRVVAEKDGHAIVEFDVLVNGTTKNVRDIDSSDPRFFNSLAIAIDSWRFEPALQDGQPAVVRCRFHQRYSIRMPSDRVSR